MTTSVLRSITRLSALCLLVTSCRNTRQNVDNSSPSVTATTAAGASDDSATTPSAGAGARAGAGVNSQPVQALPTTPSTAHPNETVLPTAQVIAVQFGTALGDPILPGTEVATFAGGCFWCTESSFEHVRGVRAVVSGYAGGREEHPTYSQVCDHATGHSEAVRVVYDPREVSYEQLLAVFWRLHDPTTPDQSFHDFGHQYRSAIYVHNPAQRAAVEASKRELEAARRYRRPIITEIANAGAFWPAEDDHQDYYLTNPGRYNSYRTGSGRDAYSDEVWGAGALRIAQQH